MKKIIAIATSLMIAGAPLAVFAEEFPFGPGFNPNSFTAPWDSPDPRHRPRPRPWPTPTPSDDDDDDSSSSSSSSSASVYNPCDASNPALGGKGCLYYVNGQIVTANGDGTITTAAGNIIDANGRIVNTTAGTGAKTASTYEFRFNHDVYNFSYITVDGVWVDPSNYSVRSGSTIITLNQAYVNTLANGTHTLTAYWTDGASMSAQFTVGSRGGSGVPNTGDVDNTAYYIMMGGALMVMAGAGYVIATNKN